MTKDKFLINLQSRLNDCGMSNFEIAETIEDYNHIIDSYILENVEEEYAVKMLGSLDEIVDGLISRKKYIKKPSLYVLVVTFFFTLMLILLNTFTGLYDEATTNSRPDSQFRVVAQIFLVLGVALIPIITYRLVSIYSDKNKDLIFVNKRIGVDNKEISNYLLLKIYKLFLVSAAVSVLISTFISFIMDSNIESQINHITPSMILYLVLCISILGFIGTKKYVSKEIKREFFVKGEYYSLKRIRTIIDLLSIIVLIISIVFSYFYVALVAALIVSFSNLFTFLIEKVARRTNDGVIYMATTNYISKYNFFNRKSNTIIIVFTISFAFTLLVSSTNKSAVNLVNDTYHFKSEIVFEQMHTKTEIQDMFEDEEYYLYTRLDGSNVNTNYENTDLQYMMFIDTEYLQDVCSIDGECQEVELHDKEVVVHKNYADKNNLEIGDTIELTISEVTRAYEIKYITTDIEFYFEVLAMDNELQDSIGYNYMKFLDEGNYTNNLSGYDGSYVYRDFDDIEVNRVQILFKHTEVVEIPLILLSLITIGYLFLDISNYLKSQELSHNNLKRAGIKESKIAISVMLEFTLLMTVVLVKLLFLTYVIANIVDILLFQESFGIFLNFKFSFSTYLTITSVILGLSMIFVVFNFKRKRGLSYE